MPVPWAATNAFGSRPPFGFSHPVPVGPAKGFYRPRGIARFPVGRSPMIVSARLRIRATYDGVAITRTRARYRKREIRSGNRFVINRDPGHSATGPIESEHEAHRGDRTKMCTRPKICSLSPRVPGTPRRPAMGSAIRPRTREGRRPDEKRGPPKGDERGYDRQIRKLDPCARGGGGPNEGVRKVRIFKRHRCPFTLGLKRSSRPRRRQRPSVASLDSRVVCASPKKAPFVKKKITP